MHSRISNDCFALMTHTPNVAVIQSLQHLLKDATTNVRSVVRPKEGMMGWDMRMGLDAARGTYIGVIDGDGQFPPESIIACLLKAELEQLDLTKTYRVLRDDGLYRRLISAVYNWLFKLL